MCDILERLSREYGDDAKSGSWRLPVAVISTGTTSCPVTVSKVAVVPKPTGLLASKNQASVQVNRMSLCRPAEG